MVLDYDLKGLSLPPRTLSLTFDDGPGPETRRLGQFLYTEGIRATFFVLGREARYMPTLLAELKLWGHEIGNHTFNHVGLVDVALAGGDVTREVAAADAVVRPYCGGRVLFRPPYGSWRQRTDPDGPEDWPTSIVAERLRENRLFDDYVGPIKWDICGEDWAYWRRGDSLDQCMFNYYTAIERIGRGIVLLHDSSEDPFLQTVNQTTKMIVRLIPMLKSLGYRFVPLGDVPEIAEQTSLVRERRFAPA